MNTLCAIRISKELVRSQLTTIREAERTGIMPALPLTAERADRFCAALRAIRARYVQQESKA